MRIAIAIGVVLSAAFIAVLVVAWRSVDLTSSSTAALAYVWIPIWGLIGLSAIWSRVVIFVSIRKSLRERRFDKRSANPS